jgi:uncharacterized membrane protein (UPF0182 family)
MRSPLPRVSRRGKVTIAVVAAALIVLIFLDQIVSVWTDWLWYTEVGYTNVYGGVLRTKIALFLIFAVLVTVVLGANLYLAYRLRPVLRASSAEQHALERYRSVLAPRILLWIGILAGLIGLFSGLSAQGHWQQWMLFQNGGSFGVNDPQFGIDVGYYVFKFPFYRYLLDVGFTITSLTIIFSLGVHYLFGGVRLQGAGDRMSVGARAHLTALLGFFVVLKAVAYFLDQRGLLLDYNSGTNLSGAGYTDINAVLPAKQILIWVSVLVALAIIITSNFGPRSLIWGGASLALLAISAVAIGGIYPTVVQQFTVKPNVRDKEAPYISNTIQATRQAYGLNNVSQTNYSNDNITPPASLTSDTTIVPTIRLLDPALVNQTFEQFQQIRSFYDFNQSLDIDRYSINGRLQDFAVGVREINYDKLTGSQTNWQNRHTVYTHGYGFVAAPANQVCPTNGAPIFVSGLIGSSGDVATDQCTPKTETIQVAQPRIYYGELAGDGDYSIVGKAPGAADNEFDQPSGADATQVTYAGTGGVPINSMFRRILYGLHFREANFLLSDVFNQNSKLIYIRNPRERAERVAPFLTFDVDPYPAVVNGRIVFILDGYTTSDSYPYSQQVDLRAASSDALSGNETGLQQQQNINYIRNSVKATVDAYDGTVTLYNFDPTDPILAAWNKAFGGNLLKPLSAAPPDLIAHFRYPEDLFKVQRDLLATFHIIDPRQYNSAQDFWSVPADPAQAAAGSSAGSQPPYYLLTQFPGEQAERFQLTAALTPLNRQNLAALLTGVTGADGKLSLELLELPRTTRVPGPGQAQQTMTSDITVRNKITLLQGQGSSTSIVYGNLLSLPYGGGLLYVEPVYVKQNQDHPFPLLKLVLVSYGQQVGVDETLQGAINALVQNAQASGTGTGSSPGTGGNTGGAQNTGPPQLTPALQAATAKVDAAIAHLQEAQKAGDFVGQGQALAELDTAIKAFEAAAAAAGVPNATPPTPGPTPSTSPSS